MAFFLFFDLDFTFAPVLLKNTGSFICSTSGPPHISLKGTSFFFSNFINKAITVAINSLVRFQTLAVTASPEATGPRKGESTVISNSSRAPKPPGQENNPKGHYKKRPHERLLSLVFGFCLHSFFPGIVILLLTKVVRFLSSLCRRNG